jgi:hypothetical protein
MTGDTISVAPVKLCGTDAPDPPSLILSAGNLSVALENGQLRYVRFGGVEALRGVAFLVRDENWGTYAPQIEALGVKETAEGFAVAYRAICRDKRQASPLKLGSPARATARSSSRPWRRRSPTS